MKSLFFLIFTVMLLTSCKKSIQSPENTIVKESVILDTTLSSVDTTMTLTFKHDPKWFTKDLSNADDENYLLESVEIFRTRFDSISKRYAWNIKLGKGVYKSKEAHDIIIIPLDKDIKILTRLDKKYHRVTKVFLLADGYGEEYYKSLTKAIKLLILSTLNSNYDEQDAELIINQTSIFSDGFYGPGVLLEDGHRYEAHKFETTMYFGIRS